MHGSMSRRAGERVVKVYKRKNLVRYDAVQFDPLQIHRYPFEVSIERREGRCIERAYCLYCDGMKVRLYPGDWLVSPKINGLPAVFTVYSEGEFLRLFEEIQE